MNIQIYKNGKNRFVRHSPGFTLIELLVVVAVIGMIASVALVSLNAARNKGKNAKRIQDKNQVIKAFQLYFLANAKWPPIAGASCVAPAGERCWYNSNNTNGFFVGNQPLVDALTPYIQSFPQNNAVGIVQANNRLVYIGDPQGANASLVWAYDGPIPTDLCASAGPGPFETSNYYYCTQVLEKP